MNCRTLPLLTKNCFICSKMSPVKEDHLQPVNMVDHDENHYQKDSGSKTTGKFYCVPWRYDYGKIKIMMINNFCLVISYPPYS